MRRLSPMAAVMLLSVSSTCLAVQPPKKPATQPAAGRLVSARVEQGPQIDGRVDDKAWASARELKLVARRVMEPNAGESANVSIRSVYTNTEVFFMVVWDDRAQDLSHKSWVWNADSNAYEEGKDREDMFSLAFEHTGPFVADMLAPVEAVWDVWHWKAFRTNPQGYAMDKTHRYSRQKPEGKPKEYAAYDGKGLWISRPEDAGDTVEVKQAAPTGNKGASVPQYLPGKPSGSAADVRAKGAWSGGRWTLELGRKLNTGHPDDTAFDPSRPYKMALGVFDRTGDMDKASGEIELVFRR
jgi:Ethylbenzene dehydrogenase